MVNIGQIIARDEVAFPLRRAFQCVPHFLRAVAGVRVLNDVCNAVAPGRQQGGYGGQDNGGQGARAGQHRRTPL